MKKLNDFTSFSFEDFNKGKSYVYAGGKLGDGVNLIGAKVDVLILDDSTVYNDGESHYNDLEKFTIKIEGVDQNFLSKFQLREPIEIYDVTKASVYGDYRNQLSVTGKIRKVNNNGK